MQPDSPPAAGETIGERLKRLRLERDLSQRELAAPGVSYAYISRIEAGTRQPSVKALRRLAAKLGVSADYLETGSDLDPAAARELRLSDLELAIRLGEIDGAETALEAALTEADVAGDRAAALRARVALAQVALERPLAHDSQLQWNVVLPGKGLRGGPVVTEQEILTMADVPEIQVVILAHPEVGTAGGGSEAANALAISAIASAFFDATGKHARRLPLKPEYVQTVLRTQS